MNKNKKIAYIQYTSPSAYTILRSGAKILIGKGWDVLFLGVGARGNASEIQFIDEPKLISKVLRAPPYGLLLKFHYIWFAVWTFLKILLFRPAVVYGSEPFSGIPLYLCKKVLRIPAIYHEHDPPDEQGINRSGILGFLRDLAASAADLCIVPGESRASRFKAIYPKKQVLSVWNGVDLSEVGSMQKPSQHNELVLWYQGAIVQSQLPIQILDAMSEVEGTKLIFAGPSPAGQLPYLELFMNKVTEKNLQNRVKYLGVVPDRKDLMAYARQADIGLCLFATPFRAPMVGASQKMFEYLASGLPLLTPETSEWLQFVRENDVGVTCDTASFSNLAATLDRLKTNKDSIIRMRENGMLKIRTRWNYSSQFEPVVNWVERKSDI